MNHYQIIPSPLGPVTILSNGTALTGLWLTGQPAVTAGAVEQEDPVLKKTALWLDRYFAGEVLDISGIPLAPVGTAFQMLVWEELQKIPYGGTTTYGRIATAVAARMGKARMSAQAVGGAVGRNPISVIIPCHRVLGADGRLTGYAGGLDKKRKLLDIEKIPYIE